jgi:hypothetical protein
MFIILPLGVNYGYYELKASLSVEVDDSWITGSFSQV